ncbi:39S ribosomal protein L37, mitochondrial [Tyrophagus putrescentiae]|nr:39S ribosomal protein L37, mitochondrial [Tyrophagus putrescentiae]
MRLTIPLHHAKTFWWGKGWGNKPRKNTDNFYYRRQWNSKRRRTLDVIEQTLPPGATPIDPNVYVRTEFNKEFADRPEFILPWPYSKRPVKGSEDDPSYRAQAAFVFHRNKRLLEPINLPLHFANAVLEGGGLPERVQKLRDGAQIDDAFADYARRRISWCLSGDSALRKLPTGRQFPYLDQHPPRVWGVTEGRKENHLLHSLYDMSCTWMAQRYGGFNGDVLRQKVSSPHCVLPLSRAEGKLALLDLECDFITVLSPVSSSSSSSSVTRKTSPKQCRPRRPRLTPTTRRNTANRPLQSIHPLSWEIAFDSRHFYPPTTTTDLDFVLPRHSTVQNIFLSHQDVRRLPDANCQGRAIMFCYGFALQQAKHQAGTEDDLEAITLERPITVSCIYSNQVDYKVGCVLFQLNSTKAGDDARCRNQVWLSEPKSAAEDIKEVLADVVTVQSLGIYN